MGIFKKNIMEDHTTRKAFHYDKGGVQLNFTLRVDIKSELRIFRDLLVKALEDIEEEIIKP